MAAWTGLSTAPHVVPRLRAAVLCYRCEEPRVLFGKVGRVLPVRGEDEMVFVANVTPCPCGSELAAVGWTWSPDSGEPVS